MFKKLFKRKKEVNVNEEIAELIKSHGFKVKIIDNKITTNFKDNVIIETKIFPQPSGLTSRLDVRVTLENERRLYESFGDFGTDLNNCIQNNIKNFTKSSLHVLLDAFNDSSKYVNKDIWQDGNDKFDVFIGDYVIKTKNIDNVKIPKNISEKLKERISEYHLKEDLYFIRFFYCQQERQTLSIELILNNINLEKEEKILESLDWMKIKEFYSIRNFIILKRLN